MSTSLKEENPLDRSLIMSNTLRLTEIAVTDLPRLAGGKSANPFAIVFVDDVQEFETPKIRKTRNPCFKINMRKSFRASSRLTLRVFHENERRLGFGAKKELLGEISSKITDLIENKTRFPLKNESNANTGAHVEFKLTIETDKTTILDLNEAGVHLAKATETAQTVGSWETPLGKAVQSLEQIMNLVGGIAEVHPISKAAWTVLTSVYKVLQQQMRQDEVIRDLAEGLRDTLAFASECSDLRQIKGAAGVISEISRAVLEAASLIDEYAQLSFSGRIIRSAFSVDLLDRIQSCRTRLTDLNTKFDRTVAVETRMIVKEMRSEGITKQQIDLLDRLPREVEARYNAARCCHGDTRKEVIDSIIDWASTKDDTKVFWLHGLAGMGKSTIATSVSHALDKRQWLGGTFFFARGQAARSKPDQLFSTIAFQMSSCQSSITSALCKAITLDLDIGHSAVVNQFQGLIKGPLCDSKDLGHPLVILLDALDECGSEKQRKDLFTIIRTEFATLPRFVKFVITSRPEADIRANLTSMDTLVKSFDLGTVESRLVDADILTFVSARMADIARSYELTIDWSGRERREALVQRAGHLFVWASTACDFIEDDQNDGPEMQLDLILRTSDISSLAASPWAALDNLYLQVLQQSIPPNASETRLDDLRRVLGTIIAAPDPLSLLDLVHVLDLRGASQGKDASVILRKLHSVLVVPPTDTQMIRIIHPSFVDFITNPSRCIDARFYIDLSSHRLHLAKSCLTRMQERLRRDICSFGNGQPMNNDIPDLDKRVVEFISGDLRYACRFWGEYLQRSIIDEELYGLVRKFIFEHLLHWLEVMSLVGIYDFAYALLMSARVSLKTFSSKHHMEHVDMLLADSIRFIQQFRIPIIANATQIYISALAFCSRSTSLSETFRCRSGDIVDVRLGAYESRTQCVATLEGHEDETGAVAMSPNGNTIVSGSVHGLLQTWDFHTGAAFGIPLAGHSKKISVIAFAPDGQFVASGSKDRTVRIWDPTADDAVLTLFPNDGYSEIVTLSFSADSTMLLIGLAEDTSTYSYYVHSIKVPSGRTDTVNESAVSVHEWRSPSYPTPDYNVMCDLTMALSVTTSLVAILLLDNKIEIFDMRTGNPSDAALEIPRGPMSTVVLQMVFSPTGRQIASSFAHSPSIYVWDVQNGTLTYLYDGFEATSLAFSPDGDQIAAGYKNGPINVWDLKESRNSITAVLEGHNRGVSAMTYSPDGNHLVSGSGDETLRIWDLRGGTTSSASAEDLRSIVNAVAFSPDGRRYVVATFYRLEAWNSSTGSNISTIAIDQKDTTIALCFCPKGDRIIAVCSYELYVWDLDKTITSITIRERPNSFINAFLSRSPSIAASHTGSHVALHVYDVKPSSASRHHLFLWDWRTCTLNTTTMNSIAEIFNLERIDHGFECSIACSPDGNNVVIGCDNTIELVAANTGGVIHTFHIEKDNTSWITSISFTPDGLQIISGTNKGDLYRCDIETGITHDSVKVHDNSITSLLFSSDGAKVISRSRSHQFISYTQTLSPVDMDDEILAIMGQPTASPLHLRRDGWVVDLRNKPICWVPAENRAYGWKCAAYGSQILLGGLKLTWIDTSAVL